MEDIKRYKTLAEEDIKNHPDEWAFAPILVATNIERLNITEQQAIRFAIANKTYVFRWKGKQKQTGRGKNMSSSSLGDVENKNCLFWQYFVPGAEAYITYNMNNSLGLVNGASIMCHSIAFKNDEDMEELNTLITA